MHRAIARLLLFIRGDKQPSRLKQRFGSILLRLVPGSLTCPEFEEFIFDYYEGSLSDRMQQRFDSHMELCPTCRVHFDAYVRAIALGQKVCEQEDALPADLPDELLGAILLARERDDDP